VGVATVTVRELARNTAAVIQTVASSGRPALVTRNGRPVAALVPVDEAALEDWLLAGGPGFTSAAAEADADVAARQIQSAEWVRGRGGDNGDSPAERQSPPKHMRGSHRGP